MEPGEIPLGPEDRLYGRLVVPHATHLALFLQRKLETHPATRVAPRIVIHETPASLATGSA